MGFNAKRDDAFKKQITEWAMLEKIDLTQTQVNRLLDRIAARICPKCQEKQFGNKY